MKKEILQKAIAKQDSHHCIHFQVFANEEMQREEKNAIKLVIEKGNYRQTFNTEISPKVLPEQLPKLIEATKRRPPLLAVAEYISSQAKEMLRNQKIPYLDTAGNFFLDEKNIFIFIETNNTNRKELKGSNRAFNKAGLKVVYQFLMHPESLNESYRIIGRKAMVTIDTVGKVIQGLLQEKFILKINQKEYKFNDREKLFYEWVGAYNRILRPKLKQNTFQWIDKNTDWRKMKLPASTCWGGAPAAAILTNYLIADKLVIYTAQPFQELAKALKIIPDPKGAITIIEQFWDTDENQVLAHPMLIYADLMEEREPRYFETAQKILKSHVTNHL